MKNYFLIALMLISRLAWSQNLTKIGEVLPNRSFDDCEGNIYSIYDILADGKPLVIFSSTVDCGYCFEEAPEVSAKINSTPSGYPICIRFEAELACHSFHLFNSI